jgi:mRNA-degrading endonuclease YafQ of YafQ-DinJ toxin-antitoxin module
MRWQYTQRFERAYRRLQAGDAARVAKAIHLLASDMRHPGLRVKRVQGTSDILEARASHSLRLTFEIHEDLLILRNVGLHDKVLANP